MDTHIKNKRDIQNFPETNFLGSIFPEQKKIKNILIIKLRHIGDVLLITPLVSTLKQYYSSSFIDVLVYKGTESILTGNMDINSVYTVDRCLKKKGLLAQYQGEKILFRNLKEQHYDLVINLSDQWRSAFYCFSLNRRFSIGFNWKKRENIFWRLCHSRLVDVSLQENRHTVINNLSILAPMGFKFVDTKVSLFWESRHELVVSYLKNNNISNYVLIQPTARWRFKTWSPSYFAIVINHIIKLGKKVIITGGLSPEDSNIIKDVMSFVIQKDQVLDLSGKIELPELAFLISQAELFVGVDSVPMHMAAALKIPSVVLFGPTNLNQWHPWNSQYALLWAGYYKKLPNPCDINTDTNERYLDNIPPKDVIKIIDDYFVNGFFV